MPVGNLTRLTLSTQVHSDYCIIRCSPVINVTYKQFWMIAKLLVSVFFPCKKGIWPVFPHAGRGWKDRGQILAGGLTSDRYARRLAPRLSVVLSPGGVSSGRGCIGWLVGVTGRLRDLLNVTSLCVPGLKVERVNKLFGVSGLLGVLGVWVLLPGLLGDWVRPRTREAGWGLIRGRPTPHGLLKKLPAGDCGLDPRLGRGRVSGSVLWRSGEWSRLLCGLEEVQLVIFPTSASLAKSFSTSGGKKKEDRM